MGRKEFGRSFATRFMNVSPGELEGNYLYNRGEFSLKVEQAFEKYLKELENASSGNGNRKSYTRDKYNSTFTFTDT